MNWIVKVIFITGIMFDCMLGWRSKWGGIQASSRQDSRQLLGCWRWIKISGYIYSITPCLSVSGLEKYTMETKYKNERENRAKAKKDTDEELELPLVLKYRINCILIVVKKKKKKPRLKKRINQKIKYSNTVLSHGTYKNKPIITSSNIQAIVKCSC